MKVETYICGTDIYERHALTKFLVSAFIGCGEDNHIIIDHESYSIESKVILKEDEIKEVLQSNLSFMEMNSR